MIKAALTDYPSICKPLHYLRKSQLKRNSQSPFFICLSSIIFGICFLLARTVPIPLMPFWSSFSINFGLLKSCQNRQCRTVAPILSSAGELLLPLELEWTLVFVSFLRRYPSDTDNQIYSNSETRIRNPILLIIDFCTASFQIFLWISPCAHHVFINALLTIIW